MAAAGVSRRPNKVLLRWGRSAVVVTGALAGALVVELVELRLKRGMMGGQIGEDGFGFWVGILSIEKLEVTFDVDICK